MMKIKQPKYIDIGRSGGTIKLMEEQKFESEYETRIRRAFNVAFHKLYRYRRSLLNLYRIVREEKKRLRKLEKIVSSFVEPN